MNLFQYPKPIQYLDDMILSVAESVSARYQKITGRTNYHLAKITDLVAVIGFSCALDLSFVVAATGHSYIPAAVNILCLGAEVRDVIRNEELEQLELEAMVHGTMDRKLALQKMRDKIMRLPYLVGSIAGGALEVLHQGQPETQENLNSMAVELKYAIVAYAIGALLYFTSRAVAAYFRGCTTQKPQKKSLAEIIGLTPKLAHVPAAG